jgi:hypothetical protein
MTPLQKGFFIAETAEYAEQYIKENLCALCVLCDEFLQWTHYLKKISALSAFSAMSFCSGLINLKTLCLRVREVFIQMHTPATVEN